MLTAAAAMAISATAQLAPIEYKGNSYPINILEQRQIGPGTEWTRLRMPTYPLNINIVTADLTNPYVRIETMQAQEAVGKTESIVAAAERMSSTGHKVIAGANGNFWCVSGQAPWSDMLIGTPFGGSERNSTIVTETNSYRDQWVGGPAGSCIIGTDDARLWMEPMLWTGSVSSEKFGEMTVHQFNKVVRENEIGIYNRFYPSGKQFQPVNQVDNHYVIQEGKSTEVYCKLDAGQDWNVGGPMTATVMEVKTAAGRGTLGNYDFCIVGHDGDCQANLAKLAIGDKVTFSHRWATYSDGSQPKMTQALQGLSLVMKDGVIDPETNAGNSYNNQIYPKTAYGASSDYKKLYILTIDKSTDQTYGSSAGCSSDLMCEIMKALGCAHAATVDAGGSTQMLVLGKVVNKTTENSPRAIANGWMVVNTAPDDAEIATIAFADGEIKAPVYSSYTPKFYGYNKYGTLVSDDVQGVTLSCDASLGTCDGATFTAAAKPSEGTLTATYGPATATKKVTVVNADIAIKLKNILIDHVRQYPIEVTAQADGKTYSYNPANIEWTALTPGVVSVKDGVLEGLVPQEDSPETKLVATLGEFTDTTTVCVESASAPHHIVTEPVFTPESWTTSVTGVDKNSLKLTQMANQAGGCTVNYRITSSRATQITLTNEKRVYSLPDQIKVTVNPGTTTIKKVALTMLPANAARTVKVEHEVSLKANEPNDLYFDVNEFGDDDYIGFFPLKFKSASFTLGDKTGNYKFDVHGVNAFYNNILTGVEDIAADTPDAMEEGDCTYYDLQGRPVDKSNAAPGLYIARGKKSAHKVIIK